MVTIFIATILVSFVGVIVTIVTAATVISALHRGNASNLACIPVNGTKSYYNMPWKNDRSHLSVEGLEQAVALSDNSFCFRLHSRQGLSN